MDSRNLKTTYYYLPANFQPACLGHLRGLRQGIGRVYGTQPPHKCPTCPNHLTIQPIDPMYRPMQWNKFSRYHYIIQDTVRWSWKNVTSVSFNNLESWNLPLDRERGTWSFHKDYFVCWSDCPSSPMFAGRFCHRELIWASIRTYCVPEIFSINKLYD